MNLTKNDKIAQITSQTLIIGVDIAKSRHFVRAQDFRGMEFRAPLDFEYTKDSFSQGNAQTVHLQRHVHDLYGCILREDQD